MESIYTTENEKNSSSEHKEEITIKNLQKEYIHRKNESNLPKEWKYAYGYPKDLIIGDAMEGIKTHSSIRNVCGNLVFVSQIEPKLFLEAEKDENWILAMQEELNQLEKNKVWFQDHPVIGTKWIFWNNG